jgi:hypothetical protein
LQITRISRANYFKNYFALTSYLPVDYLHSRINDYFAGFHLLEL